MPIDPDQLLRIASNQVRASILDLLLSRGEMNVSEIIAEFSISQSSMSQHLQLMRKAQVVETRRESPAIYYRIAGDLALLELIEWRRKHRQ
ncbi:metalloregulator ArsR/SmtB family transcription factor [Halomonas cupida]|uniref:ArsR/SmtB family transcription factor n=1 Tax=Halomonas cupida TaxID=44933 RepID=UPI0039B5E070